MTKRVSLEEAIRVSRLKVEINDELITLQSSKLADSGGMTVPPLGGYALKQLSDDDNENLTYDGKFWKGKLRELYNERMSLEQRLSSQLKDTVGMYNELREYTLELEQKCQLAKNSDNESSLQLDSALEDKLKWYESLTSTKIDVLGETECRCTIKNKMQKKLTRIEFKFGKNSNDEDELCVLPRANIDLLPSYLQNEIKCESAMAPVVFGDVLQAMFSDGSEEERANKDLNKESGHT
jgi:hypothetical protein